MGCGQSVFSGKYNKHVVIVGFSYAGFSVAELIWDHVKVTLID
jgi:hypothetical protein